MSKAIHIVGKMVLEKHTAAFPQAPARRLSLDELQGAGWSQSYAFVLRLPGPNAICTTLVIGSWRQWEN